MDRDRIVHANTFRELQYKTQVQGIGQQQAQGLFRTRLNHVLEVAQIARGLARAVGGNEALAEAIALAHDLGHPPFGHAGERALREALDKEGRPGWNANVHSLAVVDEIEEVFMDRRGLDLTWATREGIARHSTPFDEPVGFGEFARMANGGIECQIVDLADVFAYLAHDIDDGIAGSYFTLEDLASASDLTAELVSAAEERWQMTPAKPWPHEERPTLLRRWIVATLIYRLIDDAARTARDNLERVEPDPYAVRKLNSRVVALSIGYSEAVKELLSLLVKAYYRSEQVREMDARAVQIVTHLLEALVSDHESIPARFRLGDPVVDAATFVASLNDYSALALASQLVANE